MTTDRPPDPDPSAAPARDPAVDAAWRELSREEPASALDAAILAAAQRAVAAPSRRAAVREASRPARWWWPLAAAATIGAIAVGILQLAPPEHPGLATQDGATVADLPAAPSPSTSAAQPEAAPTVGQAPQAPAATRRDAPAPPTAAAKRETVRPDATPPSPPRSVLDEGTPAASVAERAATPRAEPQAAAKAFAADSASGGAVPLPNVSDWIARIRRLRAAGELDAAARELAAFRVAHPDHERLLPEDLRSWHPPAPHVAPPAR